MKKVTEFNRSIAREVAERIQSSLVALGEELGIEISTGSGTFDSGKFTVKLECRCIGGDGSIKASSSLSYLANSSAERNKIPVEGDIIGSIWKVRDSIVRVVDYSTKSRRYPYQLHTLEGKSSRCNGDFLKAGMQLHKPTLAEFKVWFTVDPDDDKCTNEEVDICDNVNDYMTMALPGKDGDKFFSLAGILFEKNLAKKNFKKVYDTLYSNSETALSDAVTFMNSLIKKGK